MSQLTIEVIDVVGSAPWTSLDGANGLLIQTIDGKAYILQGVVIDRLLSGQQQSRRMPGSPDTNGKVPCSVPGCHRKVRPGYMTAHLFRIHGIDERNPSQVRGAETRRKNARKNAQKKGR